MTSDIDWLYDPRTGRQGNTWNFTLGCKEKNEEECGECYAKVQAHIRASNPNPKIAAAFEGLTERVNGRTMWTGRVNVIEERLTAPLKWRLGVRVFVDSMTDLFNSAVPEEIIARGFAVMAVCPQHTFIILTKDHARMRSLLSRPDFWACVGDHARCLTAGDRRASARLADGRSVDDPVTWDGLDYLPNVILGVSAGAQEYANLRVPYLLQTPAAARVVSAEPLSGPIDFRSIVTRRGTVDALAGRYHPADGPASSGAPILLGGLDWIIVGGQSGSTGRVRPMHPDWPRSIRDQCAGSPAEFFFKQWGAWRPWQASDPVRAPETVVTIDGDRPEDGLVGPGDAEVVRLGKKAAGRELDGRTWDEFPYDRVAVA